MATSQNTRLIEALLPNSAPLDERTVADRLVFAARFGRLVQYYDAEGRLAGDWAGFYENETMVQYALIAATDLEERRQWYSLWLRRLHAIAPGEGGIFPALDTLDVAAVRSVFGAATETFGTIDGWRQFFVSRPDERVFHDKIQHITATLEPCRSETQRWLEKLQRKDPELLRPLWKQQEERSRDVPGAEETHAASGEPELWELLVKGVAECLWKSWHAQKALVIAAQERLKVLLDAPASLRPHFALYLAFVRELGHIQARLNDVTRRHLDFFYRDVLREQPRPAVPDRAFVVLETRPTGIVLVLAPGTPVVAPPAGGARPVVFRTESPLEISGCEIVRQVVVRLRQPPPTATTTAEDSLGPMLPPRPSLSSSAMSSSASPPLDLQAPASGSAIPIEALAGTMGFAIGSPYLSLRDGQRQIRFFIEFDATGATAEVAPDAVLGVTRTVVLKPSDWKRPYCQVVYSGTGGWVTLPPERVTNFILRFIDTPTPQALGLEIQVDITLADPSVADLDPAQIPGEFDPGLPIVQILFSQPLAAFCGDPAQVPRDVAEAFASAQVRQVRIETTVSEQTPTALYTPFGKAPANRPFPLFGAQPQVGSALVIGVPELFRKELTELSVQIDWLSLPNSKLFPFGLRSYYREYIQTAPETGLVVLSEAEPGPLPNTSALFKPSAYQVALECPTADSTPLPLFETDPNGGLKTTSVLRAPAPLLSAWQIAPLTSADLEYSPQTATGFLSVKLTAPDYAFGHQIFPRVAAAVVAHNQQLDPTASKTATPGPPLEVPAPTARASTQLPSGLVAALGRAGPPPGNIANLAARAGLSPSELIGRLQQLKGKVFTKISSLDEQLARLLQLDQGDLAGRLQPQLQAQIHGWLQQLLVQHEKISAAVHALPLVPSKTFFGQLLHRGTAATAFRLPDALFTTLAAFPPLPPSLVLLVSALGLTQVDYVILMSKLKGQTFGNAEELNTKLLAKLPKPHTRSDRPDLNALLLQTYEWFAKLTNTPPSAPQTTDEITPASAASMVLPPPNLPLTPIAERVTVGYKAQTILDANTQANAGRFYHIHPVLTQSIHLGVHGGATLLPLVAAGTWLYVGMRNVQSGQKLSLLVIPPAVPSDSTVDWEPAPAWSLFRNGSWDDAIGQTGVRDGTDGFARPGIIELWLPIESLATGSPLAESPPSSLLTWLRIGFANSEQGLDGLALLPQAVVAQRVFDSMQNENEEPPAVTTELPAGALKQLNTSDTRVKAVLKAVRQPLPSFGGRPAEAERDFYVRVSERLRHRGRAWTSWDYEHLLLQEFPEIFFAECILSGNGDPEVPPGSVVIIVLPTLKIPPKALPPRFHRNELAVMQEWLQRRASPHVIVRVQNPPYQRVLVSAKVSLKSKDSVAMLLEQLNADLQQHLSPWIYRQATVRLPGKMIARSEVETFVRALEYVETVQAMELFRVASGEGALKNDVRLQPLGPETRPSHPRECLLTADHHLLDAC